LPVRKMIVVLHRLQRPLRLRLRPHRYLLHVQVSRMMECAGRLRHKINPVIVSVLTLAGSIQVRYFSGQDAPLMNVIRSQPPLMQMCSMASAMVLTQALMRITAGITAVSQRWGYGTDHICVIRCLKILPGAMKDHVLSVRVTIDKAFQIINDFFP
jgi:hypothetical protein